MIERRLDRLRSSMMEMNLDALLVTSVYNRKYISGFTGTAGTLLVTGKKAYLFTDFRYMTQAPKQAPHFEVIEHKPELMESVLETLQANEIHQLGFEQDNVNYAAYQMYRSQLAGIELVPTDGLIEKLRWYKDEFELKIIREACEVADRAYDTILSKLQTGVSEQEIALELEFTMRKLGAASCSFDTIVASGERSAMPHGVASEKKLGTNEFVTMDFGAYYKGYCSDITRTVVLGKATDKHKEIYHIVLEAQTTALDQIQAGMTGREADAIARDIIAGYGYGDKFGHGTGHAIGMEIHESPRLSPRSDQVLEPGMVVTVEPGIYIEGFGGVRIEDDIVIREKGIDILTKSPKQLMEIDSR